ncbi:hypothetical protein CFK39_15390 [Brachybacterium avium]|uniref:Trp biosynthesis protein n=1 Tax=Brachybacterium avium TaxID=2017485 RepID=A0A220UGD7_9MICO|nr:Trp biosynthesis-associated membrane protein [Brachybacterium avium]ASK66962.1 hypothetical protein CFK39_15390 [Brachybacterium avium]
MSAQEPAARRGLPGRRTTVLAGTAASALLAGTTRTTWIDATAPDLTGTLQQVDVLGADAAPAVLALSLVAIAASLATSLSSSWLRFLTGPVLLLTGAGAMLAAFAVVREPAAAAGSAVTSATGVVGSALGAETTAWPLLALAPSLAVLAVGVLVLLAGGTWPRRDRYRSAAVTTAADPADDPAAAWDALTRGEDPSAQETPSAQEPWEQTPPRPRDVPGPEETPTSR